MRGYVAQRRGRFYAVIYEGRDAVTGKELRHWHPARTDRAAAERFAAKLAAEEQANRRHPKHGRGLAPKPVHSIHLIIRASLDDAVRRGLVSRNVAAVAPAPKQRHLQRTEGTALTDEELRQLLHTAAGHQF